MKETTFGIKHIFLALLTIVSFIILLFFCFRQWAIIPTICLFIHTCSLLLLYQDSLLEQDPEEGEDDGTFDQPDETEDDFSDTETQEPENVIPEEKNMDADICGVPLRTITDEVKASLFFAAPPTEESSEKTVEADEESTETESSKRAVEISKKTAEVIEQESERNESTEASVPETDKTVVENPGSSDILTKLFLSEEQHIVEMDLVEAAQNAMDSLSSFAETQKIKLHLSTTCEKLMMYADPDSIHILFRNIIDNSIKYMGRPGHMIITISLLGDDIFLILKDTGKGLSEDETLHVFELNFQGSNRVSGNGLGLTQTKMIVEAFGGTIYAKSSINNGMAIYIQLPISGTPQSE